MLRYPLDTDLRAYSGRALLVAAALSSSLHLALALAAPEWGGGRGLPMFRRPPLVVRLEMLDLTPSTPPVAPMRSRPTALPLPQGEGEKLVRLGKEDGGRGSEEAKAGVADQVSGVRDQQPSPRQAAPATPLPHAGEGKPSEARRGEGRFPDPRYLIPISPDGEGKGLLMVAQGGEGADSLAFAGGGGLGNLPFSPSHALPVGEEAVGGAEAVEMWEVEEPPKQVVFVEPEYPAMARRMGVEGSVVVRYLVGRDGRVEQMAVLEGPELLREASLRAVRQFTYEPVYHRGRRTKVWMRQVITFRLE